MTCKGYILIEATVGKARDVAKALGKLPTVDEAYLITGPYDIIAIVQGADASEVSTVVATQIHAVPGISRTITCLNVTDLSVTSS